MLASGNSSESLSRVPQRYSARSPNEDSWNLYQRAFRLSGTDRWALDLRNAGSHAEHILVNDPGHDPSNPEITCELVRATDRVSAM
jgi:hypothetical protein